MNIDIFPVLCNEKNMANYAYIIHDLSHSLTLVIDAAEAAPVASALETLRLKPDYILTTHHHFDHVGGNLYLKDKYGVQIIAPKNEFADVPGADIAADETSPLNLKGLDINILNAPGHTLGHILYYFPKSQWLFTGDTLFNLCIGGLFEGTPAQMFSSLQKIKALPDDTKIFPGHEYTRSCLPNTPEKIPGFAGYLQKMEQREQGKLAPATLAEEKIFNPYLQATTLSEFIK